MKKTYINPELEIVKIATQQMLATSTEMPLSNQELTEETSLLSRDFDFDDEEDF